MLKGLDVFFKMLPIVIILFIIGTMIVRNAITGTHTKKEIVLSFSIFLFFSITILASVFCLFIGYKKLALIFL